MRNVLPINMMGMAMGLHVRCGIEDNLWNQSRTEQDDDGAADRAAGAHLARVRPRGRHRQGSARDLQDRRVLRHRRGDAGRQRLRAQPPRAGSRASCARRPECHCSDAPTDPDRPRAARPRRAALADAARRPPAARAARCAACRRWAATTSTAPRASRRSSARRSAIDGPDRDRRAQRRLHHGRALGAARRGARCTARCWRRRPTSKRRCPTGYPTPRGAARRAAGCRCRAGPCRFPASSPPAATIRWSLRPRRRRWRADWGSELVDLGEVGHLNPASGYGDWPAPTRSSHELDRAMR